VVWSKLDHCKSPTTHVRARGFYARITEVLHLFAHIGPTCTIIYSGLNECSVSRGRFSVMVWALVCFACLFWSTAGLQLSATLGSSMVLQQAPANANIWGTAAAGEGIIVSLAAATFPLWSDAVAADNTGQWAIRLPAVPGRCVHVWL
jgi:hypothetical protein